MASKEELNYVTSQKFWKSFMKIAKDHKNDMSCNDIQFLLIGLWQIKHGFGRPSLFLRFKKPGIIFKPLAWIYNLYMVLKSDLQTILRVLRKILRSLHKNKQKKKK